MLRLVHDWKWILKRAWSVRFIILATILSGFEAALPYIGDAYPIPSGTFAALSGIATMAALAARMIAQRKGKEDGE